MTMTHNPQDLIGTEVLDTNGDKIGKVGNVYVADDNTHQPQWITVRTGLFGHKESFVPLAGAQLTGDGLHVATTKDMVKSAPQMNDDGRLSEAEGGELYRYYGMTSTGDMRGRQQGRQQSQGVPGQAGPERSGDRRRQPNAMNGRDGMAGKANTADGDGQTMIRSEEQLKVGMQDHETGRVRLHKHVVTEEQQVTVPVVHEELRVEREPIRDGDPAARGAEISDEQDQEIVLHEQRPVVDTETVAVEKVRLGKETVTEEQTVKGQVRKERIEVDDRESTRDKRGGEHRR
ncbi:DUF2382 domain-containing protein [Labedaea rhizosphaerae]|uniref:Uncharacterized protein (TIGR02271 family) n=1 Tax=Labedaea rhizosphaerae TaxID=598644 RepID=A0A4R6SMF8_LABRH|nr:PRC and DUF2382 domain-containing protein [Labedaea rhizosphaerae]TDQ05071.1 uncharacterized protein (TIGR02271 family) [Labedaea rhizosphaerae]